MKTLVTIEWSKTQWLNRTQFVRENSPKPTWRGAARMIAARLNENSESGDKFRPSDITIHRVEQMIYSK
jgi:hypothetical protein